MSARRRTQTPARFISPRWTEYLVHEDGWIYADGAAAEPYEVTGDDDLPEHFARVTHPPAKRIDAHIPALIDFYKRFGLLGYTTLDRPRAVRLGRNFKHPQEPDPKNPEAYARSHADSIEVRAGDPIAWALRHSANVRIVLELQRGLRHKRELAPFLGQLAGAQIPLTAAPWQKGLGLNLRATQRTQTPSEMAQQVLRALVEPNLSNITRTLGAELPFHMRALIDAIYWQLADSIDAHYGVKRCRCGALFFARDPRQRFCSALPGQRTSRCSNRFLMRRKRNEEKRKRAEENARKEQDNVEAPRKG